MAYVDISASNPSQTSTTNLNSLPRRTPTNPYTSATTISYKSGRRSRHRYSKTRSSDSNKKYKDLYNNTKNTTKFYQNHAGTRKPTSVT
jgi:hypothetical protein